MKKILEELSDIEKQAEKIKSNADKESKKLLTQKKDEADKFILSEQKNVQRVREQMLKETNDKIKSEIGSIESKGKQRASQISKTDQKKLETAQKLVIETILRV